MKKYYAVVCSIILLFIVTSINAQSFQWVQKIGAASTTLPLNPSTIATDKAGYIYAGGVFSDSMYCGSTLITTPIQGYYRNGYIVKYDTLGNFIWAQVIGSDQSVVEEINVDSTGNIYATGKFVGSTSFGSTVVTSQSSFGDFFIAKYDSSGTIQWVNTQGDINSIIYGENITHDDDGNLYVTGGFSNSLSFGSTVLAAAGNNDFFVAKYTTAGNLVWVKQAGGTGYDNVSGISASPSGDIFITGTFDSVMTCGTVVVSPQGSGLFNSDLFLAKCDSSGNFQWVEQAHGGTAPQHSVNDVCATPEGDVLITGSFGSKLYVSTDSVTSAGLDDVYIAKYKNSGTLQWIKRFGSTGYENCHSVALNDSGDIHICGTFGNSIVLGTNTLTATPGGSVDVFTAKYDSTFAAVKWALQGGGANTDIASAMALGAAQTDVYIFGSFYSTASFGIFSVSPNDTMLPDIFLAKIGNGTPVPNSVGKINNGNNNSLKVFPNPVSDKLHVNFSGENENVSIKLISLTGQILFEENINALNTNGNYTIDTGKITSGIYFVVVQKSTGEILRSKICKQ